MIHVRRSTEIFVLLGVLLANTAGAAPSAVFFKELLDPSPDRTVYGEPLTERNGFESNLVDLRLVNFDDLDPSTIVRPTSLSFAGAGGTTTANLSLSDYCANSSAQRCGVSNVSGVGRYNTTGATAAAAREGRWWDADGGFTLSFTDAITAFGFYGTDFGDLLGVLSIDLFRGVDTTSKPDDTVSVGHTTSASGGSLVFWGFQDAVGYKTIRFNIAQTATATDDFDVFGFDDMVIGRRSSVPEPTTLALIALSLGALVATRRRKTTGRA